MNRAEQLKFCKICSNRKFDFNRGIVCGLTDEPAAFEGTCESYQSDEKAILELEREALRIDDENNFGETLENKNIQPADLKKHALGRKTVKNAGNWFYIIAVLSIVNTIAAATGSNFGFIVGLGITQVFDYFLIEAFGEVTIWNMVTAIVFSGTFGVIGYYANKHVKNAFVIGMIFYGFDMILFILALDIISIGFHIFALVMIYKGFKQVKEAEKEGEF